MTSNLEINEVTQNTIAVKWSISGLSDKSTAVSPPFGLISDSYPISFVLSIRRAQNDNSLTIRSSYSSRAIVKCTVMTSRGEKQTMMAFIQDLGNSHSFDDVKTFTSYSTIWIAVHCTITWLGFSNDAQKPQLLQSPSDVKIVPFHSNENPDFHIVVGGQKLPAHKAVLAGHSSILATMFTTPMKESKENEMTITDIEYTTMATVLKIIYTGATEDLNDVDMALKVLQVAEKYQLDLIKFACECKLQVRIQDDNVLRLLDEADKYNASKVCYTCIQYIVAKNDQILSRDKLDEMTQGKPSMREALCKILLDMSKHVTYKNI